jgi:predicted transcriptional regulator
MTAGHATKSQTKRSKQTPQNHMKTKPNPEIDRQLDTEVRRRKAGIHEYTGFLLRAIHQLGRSHKTAIFTRAGATQCMLGKYFKDMEERGEIEVVGVKQMESNSKFVDEYSLTDKGERIVAEMLGLI